MTGAECPWCDLAADVAACTGREATCGKCGARWAPDAVLPFASVLASAPPPDREGAAWPFACAALAAVAAVVSAVKFAAHEAVPWVMLAGLAARAGIERMRR